MLFGDAPNCRWVRDTALVIGHHALVPETNATRPQPWFAVALIVRSTDTSLDAITASLGASPTSTHQLGERVSTRNAASARRTENSWSSAASSLVPPQSMRSSRASSTESPPPRHSQTIAAWNSVSGLRLDRWAIASNSEAT